MLDGEKTLPFIHPSADRLAQLIPSAEPKTIPGQRHQAAPEVVAPLLSELFNGARAPRRWVGQKLAPENPGQSPSHCETFWFRRWYGPPGWTCTACTMDLRVGGSWRIVTRKPDGQEIIQSGEFLEVAAPLRFVKTERWADWDVGEIVVTTELVDQIGVTLLIVTTRFPSKTVRDRLLASGAAQHARDHYAKLAALLSGDELDRLEKKVK